MAAATVFEGYSPVAGEWYPAIDYPYPKVYHKYLNKKTFDEIYPELVNTEDTEEDNGETQNPTTTPTEDPTTEPVDDGDIDNNEDLSGLDPVDDDI